MSKKKRLFAYALANQMQGHRFTDDVAICKATTKQKAIKKFRQLYGLADETNVFEVRFSLNGYGVAILTDY